MGRRLRVARQARVTLPALLPRAGKRRASMRLLARIQRSRGLRPAFVLALVSCAGGFAIAASASPAAAPSTNVSQAQQELSNGQQRVSQLAGAVSGAGQRVGN